MAANTRNRTPRMTSECSSPIGFEGKNDDERVGSRIDCTSEFMPRMRENPGSRDVCFTGPGIAGGLEVRRSMLNAVGSFARDNSAAALSAVEWIDKVDGP